MTDEQISAIMRDFLKAIEVKDEGKRLCFLLMMEIGQPLKAFLMVKKS